MSNELYLKKEIEQQDAKDQEQDENISSARKLPAAKMTNSIAQNISSGVFIKLQFDTTIYNNSVSSLVDIANNKFVIQEDGIYNVGMSFGFDFSGNFERGYSIRVNGSERITNIGSDYDDTGKRIILGKTEPLDLYEGDEVEFFVIHNEGAGRLIYSGEALQNAHVTKIADL